ncbi:MAG: Glucokinase, partial [Labilithrix sp.]|nr:Glucokinase [Labilithrix sp.]
MSLILAGDIGGTRARFAMLEPSGKKILHQEVLESRTFPTFEAALARFVEGARTKLKTKGPIRAASFGIAGPVVDQRVKTTNLPWVIAAATIADEFQIERVALLNDLVAVGLGALAAGPSKTRSIHVGKPKPFGGNLAVIAAGTGLGEAAFVWDGTAHVACPTEGSHVDFAPRTPVEVELWEVLAREYGHVSYERVASGSTIAALYTFFVRDQRVPESEGNASYVARAADPNVAVVELAEKGKSEAAMRAIELWSSVYGAEAGNLALKSLATSGIYVCGGASARLANVLADGLPARKKKGGA